MMLLFALIACENPSVGGSDDNTPSLRFSITPTRQGFSSISHFDAATRNYQFSLPFGTETITVTTQSVAGDSIVPLSIQGTAPNGAALGIRAVGGAVEISRMATGMNRVQVAVPQEVGGNPETYTVLFHVLPLFNFRTAVSHTTNALLDGANNLASMEISGRQILFVAGSSSNAVSAYEVRASGENLSLNLRGSVSDSTNASTYHLQGAEDVAVATVGAKNLLFVAGSTDDGISVFEINLTGNSLILTNKANVKDSDATNYELDGVYALDLAVVGGKTLLFAAGKDDHGFSVFEVLVSGDTVTLSPKAHETDSATSYLQGPRDIHHARFGGKDLLFVPSFDEHGVSVYEVAVSGANVTLTHRTRVVDDTNSNIRGAYGLTSTTVGGQNLLIVAGFSDSGISAYEIGVAGNTVSLTHKARLTDSLTINLNGAYSVEALTVAGETYLFVPAFSENGLGGFTISVSGSTVTLHNQARQNFSAGRELLGVTDTHVLTLGQKLYLFTAAQNDDGLGSYELGL
ncbi:MAG: hypothetical protein MI717_01705 [Spirochaetales bacterium]|nr:hypothetical protein [Spirochaetales bacterium]